MSHFPTTFPSVEIGDLRKIPGISNPISKWKENFWKSNLARKLPSRYTLIIALQKKWFHHRRPRSTSWLHLLENLSIDFQIQKFFEGKQVQGTRYSCLQQSPVIRIRVDTLLFGFLSSNYILPGKFTEISLFRLTSLLHFSRKMTYGKSSQHILIVFAPKSLNIFLLQNFGGAKKISK